MRQKQYLLEQNIYMRFQVIYILSNRKELSYNGTALDVEGNGTVSDNRHGSANLTLRRAFQVIMIEL